MKKFCEIELAYLGGLIDGDGWILVHRVNNRTFCAEVGLEFKTNKEVSILLTKLANELGTSVIFRNGGKTGS